MKMCRFFNRGSSFEQKMKELLESKTENLILIIIKHACGFMCLEHKNIVVHVLDLSIKNIVLFKL